MMRQMREATKPIMLLAAVAFVGLMVFEWGMDITGQSSGGLGEIGRVNGDPVSYDAYMAAYRNLYEQVQRSQEEPVTSQQNKEIEDSAFDEVVNSILIRQELRRRGISVTDQEIAQAAQVSPPSDLRPQFTAENGQLDILQYQTFLATLPPDQLLLLEAYYRDVIPRGKLLRQVSSGIFLTDGDLWRQYRDQNDEVEIRFVALDPSGRYDDGDFTIAAADVEEYYQAHQDEFAIPARATVKVVVLDKTPTPADTVAMSDKAEALRQEIIDSGDFAEVASRESSDEGSAAIGGDLGVFPKGRMVGPFDSVVFAARLNQVLPPVRTSFGFHVIEVTARWAQDSAQARHVLVPFERSEDSEFALLMLADSLEDMGETMALEQAAAGAGLTTTTVQLAQNFPFVQGAGQISEGADWAFDEAEPGDVSPVFETKQAFYSLELVMSEPEGILPLDDARGAIEATLRFERKMERAGVDGQQIVDRLAAGEALDGVTAEMGLEVRETEPFTRNDFVPGLGRQNAAIGAAFGLRPGQTSGVVTTPANAFVIEQVSYAVADSAAWLGQTIQQRQTQIGMLQQQRLQDWIEALRASARIVDRRAEVLAP
ncbi:MAG: peptidylprolyl isomerase, partial [Gemmatimonadetes bacterium]|nr:peptidylprolyl isomerase [Gemmatimonadota bacterium]